MSSGIQNFPYWLGTYTPNGKIQYGLANGGTGNTGSVLVSTSTAYANTSYNVQVTHQGATAGTNNAVVINNTSNFTIYWTNAGAGQQQFYWQTLGNT